MQRLTSYQHAHDYHGERASDRADAITADAERIARDLQEVSDIAGGWLVEAPMDMAEFLALLYMSRLTGATADTAARLERAMVMLESSLNAEITKAAAANVDGREQQGEGQ